MGATDPFLPPPAKLTMMPLSLIALALLASQADRQCALESAYYSARDTPGFEIRIGSSDDRLLLTLSSEVTETDYRFFLNSGEGYSTTLLSPIADETGTTTPVHIYALDADLSVDDDFPSASERAPAYLFAPELGRLLWYQGERLGGPSLASGVRETLPRTLFELAGCRAQASRASNP